MPEPLLSIDVDTKALRATLTRIGAEFDRQLLAVARETARAIAAEARRRMPQSAKPRWGSHLADHIQVTEHKGAVIVFVNDTTGRHPTNLDSWLEFGTRHMGAQPYLLPAAALEAGPHMRRVHEAVSSVIAEAGLGE